MKIYLLIIISTISIPIIYIFVTEYESNEFYTYKQLEESGLIHKGWVPKYIPKSSFNIKERHRIDAPYIYVEFNFKENDLKSLKSNCCLIEEDTYKCKDNSGNLKLEIKNNNHAIIQSL